MILNKLKFTIFISNTLIFAQNYLNTPQFVDSDGNFIVTCPGLLGSEKPPTLLTSSIGILFDKPRKARLWGNKAGPDSYEISLPRLFCSHIFHNL